MRKGLINFNWCKIQVETHLKVIKVSMFDRFVGVLRRFEWTGNSNACKKFVTGMKLNVSCQSEMEE